MEAALSEMFAKEIYLTCYTAIIHQKKKEEN